MAAIVAGQLIVRESRVRVRFAGIQGRCNIVANERAESGDEHALNELEP
jgi:hypothetical protein